MPYERSENKIKDIILETLDLEKKAGAMLIKADENKKKIQAYFDEKGLKVLEFETSNGKIKTKKSERATIKYDVDKLKERLEPDLYSEVVTKSYKVNDINSMIKLVKSAGVNAGEFKALLNIEIKPNVQRLKDLYDIKELTLKDLKGCYTATISKSIKISEETGD